MKEMIAVGLILALMFAMVACTNNNMTPSASPAPTEPAQSQSPADGAQSPAQGTEPSQAQNDGSAAGAQSPAP